MSAYSPAERAAVSTLAGLFSLRMVGLFMLLPVLSVFGAGLPGATPALVGLAVGAYGLAQLLLQIPFGLWADRFDRRRLIVIGLALFVLGGLVAALSTSIWGVILGRFLQGAGAISAVVMALLSDLVREQHRTRAMATVGMSIGLSFAVAFILGPWLASWVGLSGVFLATSAMGLAGIALCLLKVPHVARPRQQLPVHYGQQLLTMLRHPELLRLDVGIFVLHLVMTACFVIIPPQLVAAGLPASQHGWLYLPVMLAAFVGLIPLVILAEKRGHLREVFWSAIALLAVAMAVLACLYQGLTGLVLAVALFFLAFNLLEALLPSLVSKVSPAGGKGTAMGIYSTSQFLGAFLGGVLGGVLPQWLAMPAVYGVLAVLALGWLAVAWRMAPPLSLHGLAITPLEGPLSAEQLQILRELPGVHEVVVLPDEAVIHVKIDRRLWQPGPVNAWPVRIVQA